MKTKQSKQVKKKLKRERNAGLDFFDRTGYEVIVNSV